MFSLRGLSARSFFAGLTLVVVSDFESSGDFTELAATSATLPATTALALTAGLSRGSGGTRAGGVGRGVVGTVRARRPCSVAVALVALVAHVVSSQSLASGGRGDRT